MTVTLKAEGHAVNRKRIQRLMRQMGLEALVPKPTTSRPGHECPAYPYLLRGLTIERPDQVWAADITYIPLAPGFAYLVAITDWDSQRVLAWRLSNTLDASFCVEALVLEAMEQFGAPEIFNTDPGAQFTAEELIGVLRARSAKIPRLRDALRPPTDDDDDRRRRPRWPRWTSPAPLDYI